jgi:ABC-type branched-subunit amino acid transport system substrate-binding protein
MNKNNGLKTFALVAAVFLVLSWLRLDPGDKSQALTSAGPDATSEDLAPEDELATAGGEGVADGPGGAGGTSGGGQTAGQGQKAGTAGAAAGNLECKAGKNGGATDTGVTASKIRLATTAVLDGPAKTLLEDSPVAMKAVVDKVNKSGGICGRLLDLRVVNDSFRDNLGLAAIKSFIAEGYFAMPVVPSAEGLGAAILTGEISKAKIPVVGSDGMRKEQYGEPYVWPVAAATVTAMRVMTKYAATNRGAKSFALVWDGKYKFGLEGKEAFEAQVTAAGGTLVHTTRLDPDQPSYNNETNVFNGKCDGGKCDMVALLLLPETAKKWLQANPVQAGKYTAGAQTLFTDRFAQDCVLLKGGGCHGFAVWTGYNPPIGPLASLPGVSTYVNDVKAVKPGIDVNNQFVEGAYLGMNVFVEALRKVGPNLTRERLRAELDKLTFTSDLASPLTWKPGQHNANVRAQSFSMAVSSGVFRGWSNEGTGFLLDPAFGG